jgi:hypothetical protein
MTSKKNYINRRPLLRMRTSTQSLSSTTSSPRNEPLDGMRTRVKNKRFGVILQIEEIDIRLRIVLLQKYGLLSFHTGICAYT